MARSASRAAGVRSNRSMLLLALLLGLISAVLVFVYLNQAGTATVSGDTVRVVVAERDIPARTRIDAGMLTTRSIPAGARLPQAYVEPSEVVGKIARYPITAGEQVLTTKVAAQDRWLGISYVVPQGYRAMAVRVDEVVAAGGMVLPGDRVDVLATWRAPSSQAQRDSGAEAYVTILVAQNVEVLAVAQTIADVPPPSVEDQGDGSAPSGGDRSDGVLVPDGQPIPEAVTVTLALRPDDAQRVFMSDEQAVIRLLVRPFGDTSDLNLPPMPNDAAALQTP